MFRGFATISFYADDLAAARDFYTELLGQPPYYAFPPAPAPPGYLEFRVGDDLDELGIIDRRYAPPGASGPPGGAVMHWHVDDLAGTVARLLALGATEYQPVTEHGDGEGFATASVVDPFGNILGVMHNPHYLRMLAARRPAAAKCSAPAVAVRSSGPTAGEPQGVVMHRTRSCAGGTG